MHRFVEAVEKAYVHGWRAYVYLSRYRPPLSGHVKSGRKVLEAGIEALQDPESGREADETYLREHDAYGGLQTCLGSRPARAFY